MTDEQTKAPHTLPDKPHWPGSRMYFELQAERAVSDALLKALKDVLDTLGALSNPSELSNCMGEENSTRIFAAIALAEGRHE